jgi:dephospho-CoA kinase
MVIDADKIAREVVQPGTEGLAEVKAAFGDEVITPDGALDRAKLAEKVFADESARTTLNGIVHPRIRTRTAELMAGAPDDAVVVHDVPLLVEAHMGPAYHLVLVVDAPEEERVHRVVRDRGMPEKDARARIKAQATEPQRRAAADVWLDNSGTPDEIVAVVDTLWADRLVRDESNVRLRRHAPYGTPRLVAPDPTWPAQATRLGERLTLAGAPRIQRVDHIGSTSVPGLAARDILDLQLTVATIEDAAALAEPLAAAGFPQVRPHVHASADPGRPATVYLRTADSPEWRHALLLPAWLRSNPEEQAAYESLKRKLSTDHQADEDSTAYEAAKKPWLAEATARAEQWATATNWQPPEATSS